MSDRIFVEGLLVRALHGVHRHEHEEAQDFLLDMSAVFDISTAGTSDTISDTLDYDRLRDIALRAFAGASRHLLERLASQIAAEVLQDSRVVEITVTIRKPQVYPDCIPGISITRRQPFSL